MAYYTTSRTHSHSRAMEDAGLAHAFQRQAALPAAAEALPRKQPEPAQTSMTYAGASGEHWARIIRRAANSSERRNGGKRSKTNRKSNMFVSLNV